MAYWGSNKTLKHVCAVGRSSESMVDYITIPFPFFCMMNFMVFKPPMGTRSEPVTKNRNCFYYSMGSEKMKSQKSLSWCQWFINTWWRDACHWNRSRTSSHPPTRWYRKWATPWWVSTTPPQWTTTCMYISHTPYLDDITIYDLLEALIEETELLVDGAIEEPIHVQGDILLLVVLCDRYVDSIFLHDVLGHTLSSSVYV